MINFTILGASGSIGRQALEVAAWRPQQLRPVALTADRDWRTLADQARRWHPALVAVAQEQAWAPLRQELTGSGVRVLAGAEGLAAAAELEAADTVLAAISGLAGLPPLLAAIRSGKRICLANKEALVAAGPLVTGLARERRVDVLPVDSEHSAIWQCLAGEDPDSVAQLILTASGGAFRDLSWEQLAQVTPEQALCHPNWRMGPKITVDCATMVNKGLEVIEAHWLFGLDYHRIQVLIHPESIVHSLVAFNDGSLKAQLATADMRLPIQYALLGRQRPPTPAAPPDLASLGQLRFRPPDNDRFPALAAIRQAGEAGGLAPAFLNGANEELNARFLRHELPFTAIGAILTQLPPLAPAGEADALAAIIAADQAGRQAAAAAAEKFPHLWR